MMVKQHHERSIAINIDPLSDFFPEGL